MSHRNFTCTPLPEVTGLSLEKQFSLSLEAATALHPADTEFMIAAGRLQEAKSRLSEQHYQVLHGVRTALEEQRKSFDNVFPGFSSVPMDMAAAIHAYAREVQKFRADVDEAAGPDIQTTLHAYRYPSPTSLEDVRMADDNMTFPEPSIPPLDELNLSCPGAYTPGFPRPSIDGDDPVTFPTPSVPAPEPNCLGLTGLIPRQSARRRSTTLDPKPSGGSPKPNPLRPHLTVETDINHHFHRDQPILHWRSSISDEPECMDADEDSMEVDEDGAMSTVETAPSALTPQTPNIPFRLKAGPMPLKSPAVELLNAMNEADVYDDTDSDTSSVCVHPFGPSRSTTMESFDA